MHYFKKDNHIFLSGKYLQIIWTCHSIMKLIFKERLKGWVAIASSIVYVTYLLLLKSNKSPLEFLSPSFFMIIVPGKTLRLVVKH